jgi:uncharacterized protein (TIGR00159 family)
MLFDFSIKDALDIFIVAVLLYYVFRIMKESGTLNIFYGVMAFIVVWMLASEIFQLRLIGSILDKFMSIGLLILVILFQEQIKRFLNELGSHRRWRFLHKMLRRDGEEQMDIRRIVMPIVYSCMAMSKSKTGALIVVEGSMSLDLYEKSGDIIDANINTRLIENIFFKNSPLHDGALIIAHEKIVAAGCILPVSHDTSIPRHLGLRHRSAMGIAQATDAMAIVVSEETGNISIAYRGQLATKVSSADIEHSLSSMLTRAAE